MATPALVPLLHRVRDLVEDRDAELVRRFADSRDDSAFAELVRRHGPTVWAVCRRRLSHADAEDAFQATFLLLHRRAGRLRDPANVSAWLFGVARQLASDTAARNARRSEVERAAPPRQPGDVLDEISLREAQTILDEELDRLSPRERSAVILCCLRGLSRDEAARQIGVPLGTLKSRLESAREKLRVRLRRRGLDLSAVLTATMLTSPGVAAPTRFDPSAAAVQLADAASRPLAVWPLWVAVTAVALGTAVMWSQDDPAAPPAERPDAVEAVRVDRHGDPLPAGAVARLGTVRLRHAGTPGQPAYSPDGTVVAVACNDGRVHFWNPASGRAIDRAPEILSGGEAVTFSPDGRTVASAGHSGVTLHQYPGGELTLTIPMGRVQLLRFSPDGRLLAGLWFDNTLSLWDAKTGEELHRFAGLENYVRSSFAFSPDSRTVAYANRKDPEIILYDTKSGVVRRKITELKHPVQSLAFSPDGGRLFTGGTERRRHVWDARSGKLIRLVETGRYCDGRIALSPDGKTVAVGFFRVELRDAVTDELIRTLPLDPGLGSIDQLVFSPDGKRLVGVYDRDGTFDIWDVATGKPLHRRDGHVQGVTGLAFSADGRFLATSAHERNSSSQNLIRIWNPLTGEQCSEIGGDLGLVGFVRTSPDGRYLAAGTEDGTVRVWDWATKKELHRITGHEQCVSGVAFTPDGKGIASHSFDKTVRLRDVASGREIRQFECGPSQSADLLISSDGKYLVESGWQDPVVIVSSMTTGEVAHRFFVPGVGPNGAALSPDGSKLALACDTDQPIRIYDLATGKSRAVPIKPDDLICFLTYSSDGKTLAGGGVRGSVQLWEVATGKQRAEFHGHTHQIRSGVFSPDNSLLATGSEDTTVLVWDVTGLRGVETEPLTPERFAAVWKTLGTDDAAEAYRAHWRLVADPNAVELVGKELRPCSAPTKETAGRITGLIDDLASPRFAVRERASRELAESGRVAIPALRETLTADPGAEARRRIEALLRQAEQLTPDRLREYRAVETLEQINSPASRRLLKRLAGGLPGDRLTDEATSAVRRLTSGDDRP